MPEPAPPRAARDASGLTDLTDLGARLRAEWRDDEELWMRAAAQRWAHGRRLVDVVRDFGARGDRVVVEVAGRSFEGTVAAVGDDRVDVETASALVTIRTALGDAAAAVTAPVVVRRARPARCGGVRLPSALTTFRARLLELEGSGATVRVGTFVNDREYVGALEVGADQLCVRGSVEVVLSLCWVGYVVEAAGEPAP